jgi:hypothetical protein
VKSTVFEYGRLVPPIPNAPPPPSPLLFSSDSRGRIIEPRTQKKEIRTNRKEFALLAGDGRREERCLAAVVLGGDGDGGRKGEREGFHLECGGPPMAASKMARLETSTRLFAKKKKLRPNRPVRFASKNRANWSGL